MSVNLGAESIGLAAGNREWLYDLERQSFLKETITTLDETSVKFDFSKNKSF